MSFGVTSQKLSNDNFTFTLKIMILFTHTCVQVLRKICHYFSLKNTLSLTNKICTRLREGKTANQWDLGITFYVVLFHIISLNSFVMI